jgi:hypothetical protein
MGNIIGDEWYTIQKRTFMSIGVTYANFGSRREMEYVACKLENLGNIVIRMD